MQLLKHFLLVALMNRVVPIHAIDINMGREFWFGREPRLSAYQPARSHAIPTVQHLTLIR